MKFCGLLPCSDRSAYILAVFGETADLELKGLVKSLAIIIGPTGRWTIAVEVQHGVEDDLRAAPCLSGHRLEQAMGVR